MPGPSAETIHRTVAHYTGRVQGVGFRYTCRNVALQYDVAGYVRNLPDGRVELVVEGCHQQTDELLEDIRQRMACFIKKIDLLTLPATGEFNQFAIRG